MPSPRVAAFGLLNAALVAFVALTLVTPAAPRAVAQEGKVALGARWLLLRKEDVSNIMIQLPDEASGEARAQVTTRRFEPNWRGVEDHPSAPTLTVNKIWLANDVSSAQQIFQEQANAGFPEAPGGVGVSNVGGLGLPSLGDESRGWGGCGPCDPGQDNEGYQAIIVHNRVLFRYLNAVEVVYTYGPRDFADSPIAINWASILNQRVRAVPTGPPPDMVWRGGPRTVALGIAELGKEIDTAGEQEGSDARGQWFQSRFRRLKERETSHIGPLDVYNKVWVAPDIETARQIFAEQAVPGFPEAREEVGTGQFPMENQPGVGNENFGYTACNESCNTEFFRFLHHRYVFRAGNVVAVIYTWGGDQDNSVQQVATYAQSMWGRMK